MKRLSDIQNLASTSHWFWSKIWGERSLYGHVVVAAIFINIFSLSTSIFIMTVYDRVIPNDAMESLAALMIGMGLVLIFDYILKSLRASFIDEAGGRIDAKAGADIFSKILRLKIDSAGKSAGRLAGVIKEFDTLRDFFTSAALIALIDLPFILLFIAVIAMIGGWIAIVPAIALPIVLLSSAVAQPLVAQLQTRNLSAGSAKHSVVIESITSLETVKSSGAANILLARWKEASALHSNISARARRFGQIALNIAGSAQQGAQIGVVAFGVFAIRDGTLSMGALIACVILTGRALAPLGNLASILSRLNQALATYRTLNELMHSEDDVGDQDFVRRQKLDGRLEFRNVTFRYPGQENIAIEDLSWSLEPGEKLGVLGRMGSGKSTLLQLALGLYSPQSGNVLVDGVDIRQIHPDDLAHNTGVLLQNVHLFSGTLKDNILLGREDLDDEALLRAASTSGVAAFAGLSAKGYDRQLSEAGNGLSGGQKQALGLARAVVGNPPMLIMDEPTSALDTESERHLIDRLKIVTNNKTCLFVTHRHSLLTLVDKILLLEDGRCAAFGPRDQILSKLSGKPAAVA